MIGLGLGLGLGRVVGSKFQSESIALFARFATPPSRSRMVAIDNFIKALKAAGVWSKLELLYVMAAADEQAARRNWVADANNLVATNSPVFSADAGFIGDGVASYLETNLTHNASSKFVQNSAYLGHWCLTNTTSDSGQDFGVSVAYISVRNSLNNMFCRVNYSGSIASPQSASVASAVGYSSWSRQSAAGFDINKNGSLLSSHLIASEARGTETFKILRAGASGYVARRAALSVLGGALTQQEDAAFYAAALAYMQSVGAV